MGWTRLCWPSLRSSSKDLESTYRILDAQSKLQECDTIDQDLEVVPLGTAKPACRLRTCLHAKMMVHTWGPTRRVGLWIKVGVQLEQLKVLDQDFRFVKVLDQDFRFA